MKRELTRCHLRFATLEAYDPQPKRARNAVVERSVEEFAIEEPIGAEQLRHADLERLCDAEERDQPRTNHIESLRLTAYANPLRDEPDPALVTAVQRFGVVGLIAGAVGAAMTRWWRGGAR
jgi:hypothetical protein